MESRTSRWQWASRTFGLERPYDPERLMSFLERRDIKSIKLVGEWIRCSCPFPENHEHGDKNPSFGINWVKGTCNCFVCGGMRLKSLLEKLDCQEEWFVSRGKPVYRPGGLEREIDMILKKKEFEEKVGQPSIYWLPGRIDLIDMPREGNVFWDYIFSRGFSENTVLEFNFCITYSISKYAGRIIVPVHDERNEYRFFVGRAISEKRVPRYMYPEDYKVNRFLFNYYNARKFPVAIVVEGVLDAIRLWEFGFPAVACFKSSLSDRQIKLLLRFQSLIIMLDSDTAGRVGMAKAKKKLKGKGVGLRMAECPEKDPCDCTYKQVIECLLDAKEEL